MSFKGYLYGNYSVNLQVNLRWNWSILHIYKKYLNLCLFLLYKSQFDSRESVTDDPPYSACVSLCVVVWPEMSGNGNKRLMMYLMPLTLMASIWITSGHWSCDENRLIERGGSQSVVHCIYRTNKHDQVMTGKWNSTIYGLVSDVTLFVA